MSPLYLVDTDVPSELTRERPDVHVVDWNLAQADSSLFISVISIGEIRRGAGTLPPGKKRKQVEEWIEGDILSFFSGRILPVSLSIADRWGRLSSERQRIGRPLAIADGLIAATAFEHNLTLVTRNVKDFTGLNLPILNPWEPQP